MKQLKKDYGTKQKKFSWMYLAIGVTAAAAAVMLAFAGTKVWRHFNGEQGNAGDPASDASGLSDAQVQLSIRQNQLSGELTQDASGHYLLTLTKPKSVNGLQMDFDPKTGKCKLSFMGLSVNLDKDTAFANNAAALIGRAIEDALSNAEVNTGGSKAKTVINGYIDSCAYTLTLGEDGLPTHLSIPEEQIDCDFAQKSAAEDRDE